MSVKLIRSLATGVLSIVLGTSIIISTFLAPIAITNLQEENQALVMKLQEKEDELKSLRNHKDSYVFTNYIKN